MMVCVHKEEWENKKKIFLYFLVATLKKKQPENTYTYLKKNSDLKGSWEPRCTEYRNRVETKFLYLNTT